MYLTKDLLLFIILLSRQNKDMQLMSLGCRTTTLLIQATRQIQLMEIGK